MCDRKQDCLAPGRFGYGTCTHVSWREKAGIVEDKSLSEFSLRWDMKRRGGFLYRPVVKIDVAVVKMDVVLLLQYWIDVSTRHVAWASCRLLIYRDSHSHLHHVHQ